MKKLALLTLGIILLFAAPACSQDKGEAQNATAPAASEEAAWLNVLQYAVPVAAIYVGLRGVFREKVSRFIDMRLKPHRISRHGEAAA